MDAVGGEALGLLHESCLLDAIPNQDEMNIVGQTGHRLDADPKGLRGPEVAAIHDEELIAEAESTPEGGVCGQRADNVLVYPVVDEMDFFRWNSAINECLAHAGRDDGDAAGHAVTQIREKMESPLDETQPLPLGDEPS